MKDLGDLAQIINNYPADVKAEVFVADIIDKGGLPTDFLIFFDSAFKRRYSEDILKAEIYPVNSYEETLGIHISRDSLYDLLPEGLFHASPESAVSSGKGMALDSKMEYRVEEETRKFFQPFENEFFYQHTLVELQERNILYKLNEYNLNDFFLEFWKIDCHLNRNLIVKLLTMLPFAKEIIGDPEMTARCLASILDEDVRYEVTYTSDKSFNEDPDMHGMEYPLGKASLGEDMIIGSQLPESSKIIRFLIGPLKNSGIEPYLVNGEIAKFIKCFCGFFLPVEIDSEIDVQISQETDGFMLDTKNNCPVLGYSTVI
jgi:hypothetical protein